MSKVVELSQAVSKINDGDVITVSSSSALGCPDLVLKGIRERFDAESHPRDLTCPSPYRSG